MVHVFESFELESVARGVFEEHSALLPGLALKSCIRLDLKLHASVLHSLGQGVESLPFHDNPKVRDRHILAVDWVRWSVAAMVRTHAMGYDLVAE